MNRDAMAANPFPIFPQLPRVPCPLLLLVAALGFRYLSLSSFVFFLLVAVAAVAFSFPSLSPGVVGSLVALCVFGSLVAAFPFTGPVRLSLCVFGSLVAAFPFTGPVLSLCVFGSLVAAFSFIRTVPSLCVPPFVLVAFYAFRREVIARLIGRRAFESHGQRQRADGMLRVRWPWDLSHKCSNGREV